MNDNSPLRTMLSPILAAVIAVGLGTACVAGPDLRSETSNDVTVTMELQAADGALRRLEVRAGHDDTELSGVMVNVSPDGEIQEETYRAPLGFASLPSLFEINADGQTVVQFEGMELPVRNIVRSNNMIVADFELPGGDLMHYEVVGETPYAVIVPVAVVLAVVWAYCKGEQFYRASRCDDQGGYWRYESNYFKGVCTGECVPG